MKVADCIHHSSFHIHPSQKSRRLELNQFLTVFSGALYQVSYIGLTSISVPAVGVEPTTFRLKGGHSAN